VKSKTKTFFQIDVECVFGGVCVCVCVWCVCVCVCGVCVLLVCVCSLYWNTIDFRGYIRRSVRFYHMNYFWMEYVTYNSVFFNSG